MERENYPINSSSCGARGPNSDFDSPTFRQPARPLCRLLYRSSRPPLWNRSCFQGDGSFRSSCSSGFSGGRLSRVGFSVRFCGGLCVSFLVAIDKEAGFQQWVRRHLIAGIWLWFDQIGVSNRVLCERVWVRVNWFGHLGWLAEERGEPGRERIEMIQIIWLYTA